MDIEKLSKHFNCKKKSKLHKHTFKINELFFEGIAHEDILCGDRVIFYPKSGSVMRRKK